MNAPYIEKTIKSRISKSPAHKATRLNQSLDFARDGELVEPFLNPADCIIAFKTRQNEKRIITKTTAFASTMGFGCRKIWQYGSTRVIIGTIWNWCFRA